MKTLVHKNQSSFFRRSFLNLTLEKYENRPTFAEVIVKVKVLYFMRHGVPRRAVGLSRWGLRLPCASVQTY